MPHHKFEIKNAWDDYLLLNRSMEYFLEKKIENWKGIIYSYETY